MRNALIPVSPAVLTRLFMLRRSEGESLDDVMPRLLPPPAISPEATVAATVSAKGGSISYVLLDEKLAALDAMDAVIAILDNFSQYDGEFFLKLAPKVQGRTRNHIARSWSDVYPARPDLARYVKEVGDGWFIGCNIANREKEKILRAACDVLGLTFGRDLKIDLHHV